MEMRTKQRQTHIPVGKAATEIGQSRVGRLGPLRGPLLKGGEFRPVQRGDAVI